MGKSSVNLAINITRSGDCGNSPKNLFAEELAIALVTADTETVLCCVKEDIEWRMAGGSTLHGQR